MSDLGDRLAAIAARLSAAAAELARVAEALGSAPPVGRQVVRPAPRDEAALPLSANEQALFDALTERPQLGKDLARVLLLRGHGGIGEPEISKLARLPQLRARGVRHRKRVGYYLSNYAPNRRHSLSPSAVGGSSA
jgi:hypothetical protein